MTTKKKLLIAAVVIVGISSSVGYSVVARNRGVVSVQSGRVAGTLVNSGNVERYTKMGVRAVMTSFFPWLQAGAKDLIERAAAGARGSR